MPVAVGEKGREGRRETDSAIWRWAGMRSYTLRGEDFNPGTRILVGGLGPCPHSGVGVTIRSKVTEGGSGPAVT